jgi:hypothetical protein
MKLIGTGRKLSTSVSDPEGVEMVLFVAVLIRGFHLRLMIFLPFGEGWRGKPAPTVFDILFRGRSGKAEFCPCEVLSKSLGE